MSNSFYREHCELIIRSVEKRHGYPSVSNAYIERAAELMEKNHKFGDSIFQAYYEIYPNGISKEFKDKLTSKTETESNE